MNIQLTKAAQYYLEKQAFNSKPVLDLAGKVKTKLMKSSAASTSNIISRASAYLGNVEHSSIYSSAEKAKFKDSMIELGKRHNISHVEAAHAVRKGAIDAYHELKK
jgi:hypothetical protein